MAVDSSVEAATADEALEAIRLALVADLDAGFTEVVRSYERIVYSVALRMTGSPGEAEDLSADSFLRAYRALRGYDESRIRLLKLRPWLLTIVRNAAHNRVRDASRRPAPSLAMEPVEGAAIAPSVEQQVEQHETRRELAACLSQLPERQRLAVVLRHIVGLPTAEIAEVMGCPPGTAKSHVSRGLQGLRALAAAPGKGAR